MNKNKNKNKKKKKIKIMIKNKIKIMINGWKKNLIFLSLQYLRVIQGNVEVKKKLSGSNC